MKKRFLAIIIALSIAFISMPLFSEGIIQNTFSMQVNAEDIGSGVAEKQTDDGLVYLSNNKKIVICGYEGVSINVTIPSEIDGIPVTDISEHAFENSTIESLIIEPGLKTIGDVAFYNCKSLSSVTIPNSVDYVSGSAFTNTPYESSLTDDFVILGNQVLYKYQGNSADVEIPDGIRIITDSAFAYNSLESVSIPDSVIRIGRAAFEGCFSLESIDLPNSLETIDHCAFCQTGLTEIYIPESVKYMGKNIFYWCHSLKSIVVNENNPNYTSVDGVLFNKTGTVLIFYPTAKSEEEYIVPDGVEIIGDQAFSLCSFIHKVWLPESLREIGDSAFYECSNLYYCDIPNQVEILGEHIFSFCSSLKSVYIPASVIQIGQTILYQDECTLIIEGGSIAEIYAIDNGYSYHCDNPQYTGAIYSKYSGNDETFILTNDDEHPWKAIGSTSFKLGRSLKRVELPDSIEYIGSYAFHCCTSLKSLKLPSNLKIISEYAFHCCYEMTSIDYMPENVVSIGSYAFGCTKINNIDLPNGITRLNEGVFWKCDHLKKIVVPENVLKISDRCFEDCTRLSYVYIPESVVEISDDAFKNCYFLTINAPKDSYAIEYAKLHGINYVEIRKNEDQSGFSAEINNDVIDNISDSAELPVVSGDTSIIFDNNAMLEIQYKHGNKNVLLNYNILSKDDVTSDQADAVKDASALMDFELKDSDGNKILFNSDTNNGIVTITIPYKAPIKANKITVYYIASDGTKTDMNGVYDPAKKTISFTTTHFSLFTVEVSDSEMLLGDINTDGACNGLDLVKLKKALLGTENVAAEDFDLYDIKPDGKINIIDLIVLKKVIIY